MDIAKLKDEIIAYSKEIGIDKIGFTSADPFVELKQRLYTQQKLNYQSGFEESDIEKRTNPKLLLSGAESIISIALAYPSKLKDAPRSTREERRGLFCRASWGTDYHHILRDRLNKLEEFILEKIPDAQIKSMVDTGELSDRAVAERAGIGWSGKNCAVITPEFGSYVYLGEMITTIPFPSDQPIEDMCGTCTKCLEACPTGALVQGGQINATKCIGFLTQTKGFIEDEYRVKIGNRVYGCDTCQMVCPHNKGKDFHFHVEMDPDPEVVKPELKSLLFISNKEFKEKFGPLAGSWRGKKPIQRNAIIGLAHYKDETAINDLAKVLSEDTRPVLRGTAAWAIGKIGAPEGKSILERAKEKEKDEEVLHEIDKGLKLLETSIERS
ncbi:epoxyqueuosine reductase [Schinkia azotoformans MEV2011]|uniref:Epoxyqueuosine reductase n=1 Tax=Schinkia azotoformans MEV2011 TaxID=1348973 RepID=A0A072NR71_SCHAZ|nr:tRNA epoxyqueuosine(34) reductase QueG [Schinkia azotoformans]KEF39732.1 epoxyqueuosine reductase [Schinkia azotoformans MEV2011]MEC1695050.1 tRNA epoxyqueuosine(34) reductase QueG [Schinkia azotoformans]MEC1716342.1 tRNA epoxyqueuosine(34) reductase QueG [Schinkia azotoformans]MEC1726855.1 tRNA epoxyqueuosine(34) reductase QueG [Schinkia azotoformans]MEC1743066.1 tRNA epoxyqueuosine(34) reductase QueG [Schinkia azotoformans]